jgi:antitoxin (DNA-binding transcriptional repressor) of toxin-antitoxin stability system
VVTDNNEPVLRIVPIRKRTPAATTFADVRGKAVVYHEDPLAPTDAEWPDT